MTKEDILREARNIIRDEGYDALTLSSLAGKLNVKKASLYYHYSSKDAIIAALYEDFSLRLRHLGFSLDFSLPALEVLKITFEHYRKIYESKEISGYFSLIRQRKDIDEEAFEINNSLLLMIEAQTSAVIENLIERGELHFKNKKLPSDLFASALIVRLEGERQKEDDGTFLEEFCRCFQ